VAKYVCPKCGNTGPGAFRFDARTSNIRCRRCRAVAEFEPKDVTGVTDASGVIWIVDWDIPVERPGLRKQFYRALREMCKEAGSENWDRSTYSVLKTPLASLAEEVFNLVKAVPGSRGNLYMARLIRQH